MSVRKLLTMTCDGADLPEGGDPYKDLIQCLETFASHAIPQEMPAIRKAARQAGWKTGGFDYCPRHKAMYP